MGRTHDDDDTGPKYLHPRAPPTTAIHTAKHNPPLYASAMNCFIQIDPRYIFGRAIIRPNRSSFGRPDSLPRGQEQQPMRRSPFPQTVTSAVVVAGRGFHSGHSSRYHTFPSLCRYDISGAIWDFPSTTTTSTSTHRHIIPLLFFSISPHRITFLVTFFASRYYYFFSFSFSPLPSFPPPLPSFVLSIGRADWR